MTDQKHNEDDFTFFSISDVVKETGATLRQLYYWEGLGVFKPRYEKFGLRMYRRYSKRDVKLIQSIVEHLKEGFNLQAAAKRAQAKVK